MISDSQIENRLLVLVRQERRLTAEILELINLAEARKTYLERGFSSLFAWLTQHFGYSESAAMRRIQAARLLKTVPEVSAKLQSGQVNLTTLARTESILKSQESLTGEKLSFEARSAAVTLIENKSSAASERALLAQFPEAAQVESQKTRQTVVSDSVTRLTLHLDQAVLDKLNRVKDLVSHSCPSGEFVHVLDYVLSDYLKRKDPLEAKAKAPVLTNTTAAAKRCITNVKTEDAVRGKVPTYRKSDSAAVNVSRPLRREVLRWSRMRCQYKNHQTGRVCGSTYQVQLDHIYPRALGGGSTAENLRALCAGHNRLVSEHALGFRML